MSTKSNKPAAEVPATDAPREQTILTGRLTADPKLRRTSSGKPVSTIRIAVNNDDGATFHSVVVWNKTAETVCQYLKKGRLVRVTGRSQQRSYQRSDGTERSITEIIARRVEFVSTKQAPCATSDKEVA